MKKKYKSAIIIFFLFSSAFAQKSKIDSLNSQNIQKLSPKEKSNTLIELLKANRFIDIKSAIKYGEQALISTQNLGDKTGEILVCQEMSKCLIADGKFKEAITFAQKGITLAQSIGDKKSEAVCLSLEGYLHRRMGEIDQSLKSYTTCLEISKAANFELGMGEAFKGFGDLNEKDGKYAQAIENYTKALKYAQQSGNKELEMATLNATGIIYDYQGNLEKGLEYYLNAVKIAENLGNLIKVADYSGNIGSIQFYLKHDDKAIEYFQKSLEICRKTSNKFGEASACQGLVTVYNHLQKIDEAQKYATEDLRLRLEMNDERGMAYAYKNLGAIAKQEKNYENAEEYFLKGLEFAEKTKQKLKIGIINLELGRLMNIVNQFQRAEKYLKNAIGITQEIGVLREQSFAYEDLAITYERSNRMREAFYAQKQFSKLNGELLTKDLNEQTVKMETIYETKNKELKISSLEKEAKLKEELIKQSNLVRNLSLVGLFLFLMLAGLFYNRSRLKQQNNVVLQTKNAEIEKQSLVIRASLKEKEILLKELHHRVKNNLAIVSSLLRIQSNKLEDAKAIQAVRQGQQRIDAMSMIHQRLYQTDKITSVNIKEYINDLAESLMFAYGYNINNFDLELNIENEDLDVDLAMPMGLIINELLTNAFKYAYTKTEKPTLKISLKKDNGLTLEIQDNGIGIDLNRWKDATDSFGKKLIAGLTHQLEGEYTIEKNKGTFFKLHIPNKKLKTAA